MSLAVTHLLRERGETLSVARSGGPQTYNAATGTMTGGTPVQGTFRGVFINYEDKDVDGTHVQMTDRKLLIDALSSETTLSPTRGDTVSGTVTDAVLDGEGAVVTPPSITGGVVIERVRSIAPNGTPIAYICQVRG
jgi:hypothetical protein